MKIRIRAGLSALMLVAVAIAALALAPAAEAKVIHFHFKLTGKAETPPTTSKGKGHGAVSYNDKSGELKWKVVFSGLTGDATAAHFHGPAKVGEKAGVVVPIKDPAPLPSPLIGSADITPDQAKDLIAGLWYFNIHTAANPGGEIRGQVWKSAVAKAAPKP